MTSAQIRASYRRGLSRFEMIYIRRFSGPAGPSRSITNYGPIWARVTGFEPDEFIGSIVPSDRKIIALSQDVDESGIQLPLIAGSDKVVYRNKELVIKSPDASTRRTGDGLYAYQIVAGG